MRTLVLTVSWACEDSAVADVVMVEDGLDVAVLYAEYLASGPGADPNDRRGLMEGFADWGVAHGRFHKADWFLADLDGVEFKAY